MDAGKAWLITILRREAQTFERKQFEMVDIDDVSVKDDEQDADDILLHHQIRQQIMMLSAEYRDPLLMQVVLGPDSESISQVLNISKQSVLTRLFRARNQLRNTVNKTSKPSKFGCNEV